MLEQETVKSWHEALQEVGLSRDAVNISNLEIDEDGPYKDGQNIY